MDESSTYLFRHHEPLQRFRANKQLEKLFEDCSKQKLIGLIEIDFSDAKKKESFSRSKQKSFPLNEKAKNLLDFHEQPSSLEASLIIPFNIQSRPTMVFSEGVLPSSSSANQ